MNTAVIITLIICITVLALFAMLIYIGVNYK